MHHRAPILPILVTAGAIGLLSLMDAFMKDAALAAGAYSASWLRGVFGFVLIVPVWIATRKRWPARDVLAVHILRGTISSVMSLTFFFALTRLHLAEAIAISFIAPLMALFLAGAWLKEDVGPRAYLAALLGLVGTVVIVGGRISSEAMDAGNWIGLASLLLSAALYAFNLVLQRKQAQIAGPVEIATFQNAMIGLVLGLGAPFLFTMPATDALFDIGMAAALTVSCLVLLAWAYARAEAQVLVPLEYSGLVWAALFGWMFFGEHVTLPIVAGAALIVLGCWIAALRKRQGPASEQAVV